MMNDPEQIMPERKSFLDKGDTHSDKWHFLGSNVPKSEIVYFCQMFIVYIIIITSVVNLSIQNGSSELWISLLSSCIGYALPSPKLKK